MVDSGSGYYRDAAPAAPACPALAADVEADTVVVGGGYAGLNTALGLAERGHRDVVLLEARRVGFGASGRNGGFVFGGFSRGESALLADLGPERARRLYLGTLEAVRLIRRRIDRYGIRCQAVDAGVLWLNWFRDPEVLRRRQRLLADHFGVHWQWLSREQVAQQVLSPRYSEALFESEALHFNPLAYARGLTAAAIAQGVQVYEDTPAVRLEKDGAGWRVRTPSGIVRARRVVLACGGYLAGLHRQVDAAVLPIATYVMVTEPLGASMATILRTRAALYDTRFAFDYYRPTPDGRLLWGGRISVRDRSAKAVERLLRKDMTRVFPQLEGVRIEHAWSGLMSYARHEMPQIGEVEPGLWLAQAFGGHGVAPTTFAGELLAAAIAEGDGRWRELSGFGLSSVHRPFGLLAAQLAYWWLQGRDAWKDWMERRPG
ncbi:NAD(P)/FAD-dependent oxidoreductase [Arenimonas fontis]|uniref:FAD-binding oxidoreductase n=1 Tax=Arenimonas fontis TaxID=2608255 RepID=A0A5B2ZFZ4_9GAMM|nr:FAD-binding oxidoreductase [Arenimonas fontis]KAA2285981.1 FAD-binding oxidoreductase [Arenimonas fontis]